MNSDILRQPFDVETHKKNFVNYLEIVISPEGVIKYAVPSHNGYLENVLRKQKIDPIKECPKEYYADYYNWLCIKTGYIMVWGLPNSRIIGTPNEKQQETLDMLRKEELL